MSGFIELGEPMEDIDRFMTDASWRSWARLVAAEADRRGAWLILGCTPGCDLVVFDVLDEAGREAAGNGHLVDMLQLKLQTRNVRYVRFYRWAGLPLTP